MRIPVRVMPLEPALHAKAASPDRARTRSPILPTLPPPLLHHRQRLSFVRTSPSNWAARIRSRSILYCGPEGIPVASRSSPVSSGGGSSVSRRLPASRRQWAAASAPAGDAASTSVSRSSMPSATSSGWSTDHRIVVTASQRRMILDEPARPAPFPCSTIASAGTPPPRGRIDARCRSSGQGQRKTALRRPAARASPAWHRGAARPAGTISGSTSRGQPGFQQQPHADRAAGIGQHPPHFHGDPFGADDVDFGGHLGNGLASVVVECKSEGGREPHRPQHPQLVFGKSLAGAADRPKPRSAKVFLSADEVDHPLARSDRRTGR